MGTLNQKYSSVPNDRSNKVNHVWRNINTSSNKKQENNTDVPDNVKKIRRIIETVEKLSFSSEIISSLEEEQWLSYYKIIDQNIAMKKDLREALKRNENMLNLFRQSVTGINFGAENFLPTALRIEVQRSWHQKYDRLLHHNEQLKKQLSSATDEIKNREMQIEDLQQRLLNLAKNIIKRNDKLQAIRARYKNLEKYKNRQEILLKETIELLQNKLRRRKAEILVMKSGIILKSTEHALLAREIRKNTRLSHENIILKQSLLSAKRESGSSISFVSRKY